MGESKVLFSFHYEQKDQNQAKELQFVMQCGESDS